MSLTIDTFKAEVAGLLNRDPGSLIVNGVDVIVSTMNRGRRWAQTQLDFEKLRVSAQVQLNLNTNVGTDLNTAVLAGTTTPVSVNKIKSAYLIFQNSSILQVEIVLKDQYLQRLGRRQTYDPCSRQPNDLLPRLSFPTYPVVFVQNNTMYLWPTDNTQVNYTNAQLVGMDVIKKDGDYVASAQPFTVLCQSMVAGDAAQSGPWKASVTGGLDPNYFGSNTFKLVGSYNTLPLFQATGGYLMWIYWMSDFPTAGVGSWVLGQTPGDTASVWYSPPGTQSFNSTGGWTAKGFLADASTSIGIDPVQYDISASGTADFWLDEAVEWLQLYTIQYLQTHFIKSSERWPVTQQMLQLAWTGVTSWNNNLNDAMPSYDLD